MLAPKDWPWGNGVEGLYFLRQGTSQNDPWTMTLGMAAAEPRGFTAWMGDIISRTDADFRGNLHPQ